MKYFKQQPTEVAEANQAGAQDQYMNEEGEVIDCAAPQQDYEPSMQHEDAGGEPPVVEHNFVEAGESLDGFCSQIHQGSPQRCW